MTRLGLVARGWAGVVIGLVVGALVFGLPGAGAGTGTAGSGFDGALLPANLPAPSVTALHDEDGRPAGSLRGQLAVVAFVSAVCRDECPITVQTIRQALHELGHGVPVALIAVDPTRDTPAAARRFLVRQRVRGQMRFLLGGAGALSGVWRGFGVQPQTARLPHQARIVLLDRRGMQRVGYFTDSATPEQIAHDLRVLGA